ncbi:hypothetical protein ACFRAR_07865 [Kitasatospora sp. NPDC056651]|uniref:hypothetical protein n=1 Tax=Kitasatospora sp. NPDC056651 TaxID=3345892 RepID=UPI0036CDC044
MPARSRHLPRHLSWPLSSTDIRAALGDQEADAADLWFAHEPWSDGTVLQVEWIPPIPSNYGRGFPVGILSPLRIRVGPLAAAERALAREALRRRALPALAAWVDTARHAPDGWSLCRHSRSWRFADGTITHREDQQPYR